MNHEEKLETILNLLTDKTWGELCKEGMFHNKDEKFGALVMLTHVFNKAYKIAKSETA